MAKIKRITVEELRKYYNQLNMKPVRAVLGVSPNDRYCCGLGILYRVQFNKVPYELEQAICDLVGEGYDEFYLRGFYRGWDGYYVLSILVNNYEEYKEGYIDGKEIWEQLNTL